MSKLSTTCSSAGILGQESQGKKARKLQPPTWEQGTNTQWEGQPSTACGDGSCWAWRQGVPSGEIWKIARASGPLLTPAAYRLDSSGNLKRPSLLPQPHGPASWLLCQQVQKLKQCLLLLPFRLPSQSQPLPAQGTHATCHPVVHLCDHGEDKRKWDGPPAVVWSGRQLSTMQPFSHCPYPQSGIGERTGEKR